MSLKKKINFKSLKFRINFLISSLFILSSIAVFLIVGVTLYNILVTKIDKELKSDYIEFENNLKQSDLESLIEELNEETKTSEISKDYYVLIDDKNSFLIKFGPFVSEENFNNILKSMESSNNFFIKTIYEKNQSPLRIFGKKIDKNHYLIVGSSLNEIIEVIDEYNEIFYRTVIVVFILGLFIGWFISKESVEGIDEIRKATKNLEKGNYSSRINKEIKGSELKELSASFNSMASQIEKTLNEMEQVTGNVAHDLKSPLTRIRSIAELSLSNKNDNKNNLGLIIYQCDLMIGVVDTMLDIAKINAGLTEMNYEKINILETLENLIDLIEPMASEKNIEIDFKKQIKDNYISGDKKRIQRLFSNLVDNAIKYSNNFSKLKIQLTESNNYMEIVFKDEGQGICEKDLPFIFDRFYRGEKSRTSKGTGLGLSLVQAIVKAHKGEIKVSSTKGKGSTFTVTLPK